ncbi:GNAT family N-acetyltransferase [Rhizosphaericola mali]|uniref:GNAT family N-acetyltransferase n=1 Tax=Rhizosphaericola mali TaxID=2545455 RepID=A0A5P2FY22_9BACT|nr:GNAT family N-acetyltransferase [Rhizosphaericola mali]QES87837.1 GNAT family N-acetyltransferase [Rhizosphaericola mali]
MEIQFRKGKKSDSIQVAPLIVAAMGELAYKFIGKQDYIMACQLFAHFVTLENNQYSYQNLYVAELDSEIIGMILAYDGENLDKLRKPLLAYLAEKYAVNLNSIQDETQEGEFYLDCIAILPKYRGLGIAGKLLKYVKAEITFLSPHPLGLIVEKNNNSAINAYLKCGFDIKDEKKILGQAYWHMQLK